MLFTSAPFPFQQIRQEARRMKKKLEMSLRAIGKALGVDGKTIKDALQ